MTRAETGWIRWYRALKPQKQSLRSKRVPEDQEECGSLLIIKDEALREVSHSSEMYNRKVKLQRKVFTAEKNYVDLGLLLMQEEDTVCLMVDPISESFGTTVKAFMLR
jgi:hypothetical protein